VRCHDDIGWTFDDADAARLGINGSDHRQFLNEFYRGRFPGSFARGLPFQENPKTGDCRISGTCASLAGLEKALSEEGPAEVELAIRRIALLYDVVMTLGGIPLIYLGDEIGMLNDYGYLDNPAHKDDSRWVHRPSADAQRYARRDDPKSLEGRVYANMRAVIAFRKGHPELAGGELEALESGSSAVLMYARSNQGSRRLLILANFSEKEQLVSPWAVQQNMLVAKKRLFGSAQPLQNGTLRLPPYDFSVFG